jgi:hypothetical protein
VAVALLALAGCGHARNAVHSVTPTAPPDAGPTCPALSWRCSAGVPERCTVSDNVARWYSLHPLAADGRPAPCAHACTVDTVAHCAAEVTP